LGGRVASTLVAIALAALPAASARAADPVLAAAGDIACESGSTVTSTACEQSSTASLLQTLQPTAIAPLGDEQYNHGTYAEFTAPGAFGATWGALGIPFHPVPGNHEYDQSATAAGYFQYFGTAAPASYYSYDLGQWHVVALDSNCDDDGCANRDSSDGVVSTAEVNWLKTDLAQNTGKCVLAYWHHPLFSSGDVGGSTGVKPLWTALYTAHADLVLNGHEHHYERFGPQDPTGVATTAGIREIVVGTGGHDIEQNGFSSPPADNSQLRDNSHFGALVLTLHPHSYDWAFKATPDGSTVVDSGTASCHEQPPVATTGQANPVGQTTATLAGSVNPQGQATTYHFEYGTTSSYGASTTSASGGSGTTSQPLSAGVTGLSPSTTYHFRIVATNASGTTDGADQTFTTQPPPPSVTTGQANPVGQTSATVAGSVDPHGVATTYHFDYGTTSSYGASTADESAGSGTGTQSVSANVGGLAPATTYHFRLVATSASGTTDGTDQTFTTQTAPPSATTGEANPVGQTTATLNGSVDPDGQATTYHFDYGTTSGYGSSTSDSSAGSGSGAQPVSAAIAGLTPSTTYHFRVVATNRFGTAYGADQTFTAGKSPPGASTGSATSISQTAATLNGAVDPHGQSASYHFDYGTTSSYGTSTPGSSAGSGTASQPVSADITGLTPGATYHFRIVATNASGTTYGSDQTFTTESPPPSATTGQANAVGQTSAALNGSVDPHGVATTVHFDYGTTSGYGASTAGTAVGSGSGSQPVSAGIGGLAPSTTYHFRVVASSASGTTYGADQTFTTAAPPSVPAQTNPGTTPPAPKPSFRLIPRRSEALLLRRGLLIGLTCPAPCTARAALEGWLRVKSGHHHGPIRLGRGRTRLGHAGKTTFVIRLTARAQRQLGRLRLEIVLDVRVTGDHPTRQTQAFTLNRAVRSAAAAFAPF
jgi:hypothetical protein